MIRTPLRPLARVLRARETGENPDAIERENLRLRHEEMRDKSRVRAEGRLMVLALIFFCAFGTIGGRMGLMAASEPEEPRAAASGTAITAQRADITDRTGRILATNLHTYSLYAQPPLMIDKVESAEKLVQIFPDLDRDRLVKDFTGTRKFLWIKKRISPEQMQAVHDIGDPGLLFGPREMRLYPNGKLAAHILGGSRFGEQGVSSAEVIGVAGVEKAFDSWLRDPANEGKPLQLSIDLTVQSAVERVLYGGMKLMNAKGAAAVLMDVHTGEVISMVSLPTFDPNDRPRPLTKGDASDSPLFNRAVQGVYELGSTFKIFAAAQAMELGLVGPDTLVDADAPMTWGRYRIKEFEGHNYGPMLSVRGIIEKSSNVGTAHLALQIGADRQQDFLRSLGFFDPTPVELIEAPGAAPLIPKKWSDIVTITTSYGHGMSASPLHLATAYSSLLNGGHRVKPTLIKNETPQLGPRIVSEQVSRDSRDMLRGVVEEGTASFGEVRGYQVGGKTGTADKPKPTGGYYHDKVIATFASVFPASDPKYVLILTLDEPVETSGDKPRRTAGWTAVPVAAETIRRVAPLLGLRPIIEPVPADELTLVSNQ
ncbi:penicillin-binding protein 2 [Mesobaculum littorinae]|uniref:Penicillin-binding protein 2 n=1 Tax=Mesobaculum littorinae TaxID=2486419 RepID=A0A438AJ21_9RHOB|nr:penicillin-binding protein 2 [Mesobaculum littorinae]RVV98678.1 penicillin-binding protein 2 [Mesobaculum littorinae]